jgi:hypothetical protein
MQAGGLRRGIVFAAIAAALGCGALAPRRAAAADPIMMFLMSLARDLIEQHAVRRHTMPPSPEPIPETYPGTLVEPKLLRRLIDDSFLYLSEPQRHEIFMALHETLMDPKNAALRASLIEYFASRALSVRALQLRLAQLGSRDKEQLALEFRKEVSELSAQERTQIAQLLRQGMLPVPPDLGALLLAEVQSAPAGASAAGTARSEPAASLR